MSAIVKAEQMASDIERVLVGGDLSKLTAEQRVSYYNNLCESLGLNPLTKPFEYLTLNGKTVLYARRDCTDQLRKIHRVSIKVVSRESADDMLIVTTQAMTPDGRTDESIAAVSSAGLKGEALANALMKVDTKAKRRVTLSICGLGMLDETEVETVPGAAPVRELPKISPHMDEPDFVQVESSAFDILRGRLESIENSIAGAKTYDDVCMLRGLLGSKAKQSQLTALIQSSSERNELNAEQRKELGKTWQRANRQLAHLELGGKYEIKAPDLLASFVDEPEEKELA